MIQSIKEYISDNKQEFTGPAGQTGPPGPPGQDAPEIDYDQLASEVLARLPPIYPQWIDNDGNVIDSIPGGVRLGQTLPLRIDFVIRQMKDDARTRSN